MKSKTEWIRFANKFLIASGVLAIICTFTVKWLRVRSESTFPEPTVRRFDPTNLYIQAMNWYYCHYHRFPVHCTNITELVQVLNGEDINGDNPDKIKFFNDKVDLEKLLYDEYRFPFDLSVDASGTNFILRSYGTPRYREHYLKNSAPPIQHQISVLYPGIEERVRNKTNALTVTNQSITGKGTNHVNSTSQ